MIFGAESILCFSIIKFINGFLESKLIDERIDQFELAVRKHISNTQLKLRQVQISI
jgi:hypothetical protein